MLFPSMPSPALQLLRAASTGAWRVVFTAKGAVQRLLRTVFWVN